MPAIQLPRLRQQVEQLAAHYADPDKFGRELAELFNYYGDRIRRPSKQSPRAAGLPEAHVPAPVLRQIVTQLTPYAESAPHAVLNLARALWARPTYENRLLAIRLLGKVALSQAEEVLRLAAEWGSQNQETRLLDALADAGLSRLRAEDPQRLLDQIQTWLYPESESQPGELLTWQKLALSALLPFAADRGFENLPRLYSLLKPTLRQAPKALRPYLLDLMRQLAARSPQEVAYILNTELDESPGKEITWLARRAIETLPEENQIGLRARLAPKEE